MIKVMVVDDSLTSRESIKKIINSVDDMMVVAVASNGLEAIDILQKIKVDIITMDILMPGMDGFVTTSKIMQLNPVPIIILSACYNPNEVAMSFKAIEAGAVAIMQKTAFDDAQTCEELINTIRLMSEIKVVRRKTFDIKQQSISNVVNLKLEKIKIIAIGASTGGPAVIQQILSALPKGYPLPIVVVQHIASGFTEGMVRWLQGTCNVLIKIASNEEKLLPGVVYFAPDDRHIGVSSNYSIIISDSEFENAVRPSVSYLFRSISKNCASFCLAIVLTGMGKDGAEELKMIKDKGGITIAQDEATSLIYGMPMECVKANAVTFSASPDLIKDILLQIK